MTALNKQALKPGLYAILFRNNWDGEGDTYEMLASLDANLTWHNYETGKELFEYEGDEILKSWLLNDSTTTDALEAAEKRIAELEARTVTLPDVEKWRSVDAVRAQNAYKVLTSKVLTASGIDVKWE